jgi:hypothetical protein
VSRLIVTWLTWGTAVVSATTWIMKGFGSCYSLYKPFVWLACHCITNYLNNISDSPTRKHCLKKNAVPSQNLPVSSCKKLVGPKKKIRRKQERPDCPKVLLHSSLISRIF